jgi:uncharacterized membrane protein YeaQ/YmgE (transglycosylase-associated protein family)
LAAAAVGEDRAEHHLLTTAAASVTGSANERSTARMSIIGFLLLGLIAGAIARAVMPGPGRGGVLMTLVIGVVGALLGGVIASYAFNDTNPLENFFDLSTWAVAIGGSILLLLIWNLLTGERRRTLT